MHVVVLQLRVRVCVIPHEPEHARVSLSLAPGAHVALVAHEPVVHPPHRQLSLHVRVSVCVPSPHAPHAALRVSVAPRAHSPSPMHTHSPHVQSALHVRRLVPQLPHAGPISTSPALHAPIPLHTPSFVHVPSVQTCCCVPHRSQPIVRGSEPGPQSQLAGASQAPHTPSVQRASPSPQAPEHVRCAVLPMLASLSSQSLVAGTPSPSASAPGVMHTPSRHTSSVAHAGVHPPPSACAEAASSSPPSPPRRWIPSSPVAHATSSSAEKAKSNDRTARSVSHRRPPRC